MQRSVTTDATAAWFSVRLQPAGSPQLQAKVTVMFPAFLQSYQLLNCDDHATYLMKHKKDPALYRPDICHQVSHG